MKLKILPLFLFLVNCLAKEDGDKPVSIDEISGKRYEFGLFENVDGSKKVYGLQFHPESIMTPEGPKIIENFINICK